MITRSVLFLATVGVLLAQPATSVVACKVSIEPSTTMKALYGGKVPVLSGNLVCKNYTGQNVNLASVDVYLALTTIDTMPASDAMALLNKVYQRSGPQELSNGVNNATTGIAGGVATGFIRLAARTLGWEVFGTSILTNVIVPLFTAGQPSLTALTSNQCDSTLTNLSLAPGGTVSCTLYIPKPSKKATLPGSVVFYLSPSTPPPPGGLPVTPPPVMLRPSHVTVIEPENVQKVAEVLKTRPEVKVETVVPTETHPQVASIDKVIQLEVTKTVEPNAKVLVGQIQQTGSAPVVKLSQSDEIRQLKATVELMQAQLKLVQEQLSKISVQGE